MDSIGILLTFLSTALITMSRVIGDQHKNARNYLVYLGLIVSAGAVFVTYNNVQSQKERLRKSSEENEKFKEEVKGMKLKMYALNGQIEQTTTSLLQSNDATSIALGEKLKNSTGQLLSASYSNSSIMNDLLEEQNDSLKRMLVKTVNILKQTINASELDVKTQLKESETAMKQLISKTETNLKIDINNLEEHVDDKFDENDKLLKALQEETEDDSTSSE